MFTVAYHFKIAEAKRHDPPQVGDAVIEAAWTKEVLVAVRTEGFVEQPRVES